MESVDIQGFNAHWGHEPFPLTRPSGTRSPVGDGGEGRGEGARGFIGSEPKRDLIAVSLGVQGFQAGMPLPW